MLTFMRLTVGLSLSNSTYKFSFPRIQIFKPRPTCYLFGHFCFLLILFFFLFPVPSTAAVLMPNYQYETVTVTIIDKVAHVQMNRPKKLNAFNPG
jgi:hypothetical protein